MKIDFKDRVVLVTGATSGIGKEIAKRFDELNATLILTGNEEEEIKVLNSSLKDTVGRIKFYYVDFTCETSVNSFFEDLKSYERIDVCINNAGINRIDFIDETRLEDWNDIINVNLKGPFRVIREVSKVMKKHKYGRVINVSSIFGFISKAKRSIYSASKFGLNGLTVSTSNELARYNVLVNSVSPGFVMTDLTKRILTEKEMEDLSNSVPIGRFAMPCDIANIILFLASDYNTYITGQNIIVDGGYVNV